MTNLAFETQTHAKNWLGEDSSKYRQTFGVNCFSFNPQNQMTSAHHAPFGKYFSPQPIYYQVQGDYDLPVNPNNYNPDKNPRWAINKYDIEKPISASEAKHFKKMLNKYSGMQAEMHDGVKYDLSGYDSS